jgi:hypothetical protein
VLVGHWVDQQLGMTVPVFVIVGFLLERVRDGDDLPLVNRFLSRWTEAAGEPNSSPSAAQKPRSCM